MKIRLFSFFILLCWTFFSIFIGCSKEEKAAKQEGQKRQGSTKTAKVSQPKKEEYKGEPLQTAYHYNSTGKIDPFRPLIVEEAKSDTKGIANKTGSIPPLQRYELDQLRLVGVITNVQPPRALVEDVAGDGYIVIPGDHVGRNEGVITDVKENEIIVEEKELDVFGKLTKKKNVLKLHQPEELEEQ